MKAIVYDRYGTPDVLRLEDVPKPEPGSGEVLVEVHATSVNSWDWDLLTGRPLVFRLMSGLLKPKFPVLGGDIAGRVVAVGPDVNRFRTGDEVFGDLSGNGWGGFAGYVCAPERLLAPKSANMTFEEAAAIPQAGLLALQGLRDRRRIAPGDKVLINGAGGGFGTFAIQIARHLGAEVTGVDHTAKLDLMRAVGADHVIDYTSQDYTRNGERYDLVLDAVARRPVLDYARALAPGGAFVMVGGAPWTVLIVLVLGSLISMFGRKTLSILAWHPSAGDLKEMTELYKAGHVRPVIDRCYGLDDAAMALRRIGSGEVRGKIVIAVDHEFRQ